MVQVTGDVAPLRSGPTLWFQVEDQIGLVGVPHITSSLTSCEQTFFHRSSPEGQARFSDLGVGRARSETNIMTPHTNTWSSEGLDVSRSSTTFRSEVFLLLRSSSQDPLACARLELQIHPGKSSTGHKNMFLRPAQEPRGQPQQPRRKKGKLRKMKHIEKREGKKRKIKSKEKERKKEKRKKISIKFKRFGRVR